ncbi:magnesium-protoporphyrin O-methyltransferase [Mariprofundus micogutta]|uniref:Magnesium-protoporphyrin O-methyltransferase n=1 Tax=Mariprofundus micogutta TaxID=1921010 RepID=A0A1L8CQ50_9PROT|nr:methyltransferase domain-containing protein [Mariprofundus micogutta]GAV21056.1 magnesium-protoporphyrin O-methyltransferase [Mariprofundus micogutta]
MTDRAFWEAKYENKETGWDRGGFSPALSTWLETLEPCRILVPGCGRGHEVIELARRGFDVVAVDVATPAINHMQAMLEKEKLSATLIHADLFELELEPFDAIYEQTCLCALQPTQWEKYEQWLHTQLKPGGQLLALFMQTGAEGGPPFHCDLSTMKPLFDVSRWQWPDNNETVVHPSGRHELAHLLIRI